MKKLLILFAALLLCSGCDEKKNEDSEPVQSEPIQENIAESEDAALEAPFLTLSDTDFKDINVPVKLNESEPPDEVKYIDLEGLDFGEKLPVCASADNWKDYYPDWLYEDVPDMSDIELKWRDIMQEPQEGQIEEYTFGDGAVYFFVSYDTNCSQWNHSTAFFRYDIESGELKEITAVDSLDRAVHMAQCTLKYFNGKLYYIGDIPDGENSVHYCVYSVDTETGEINVTFDDEAFSDRNAPNYPLDTLVCDDGHLYAVDVTFGKGSDITDQVIYELNSETGEWNTVFMGHDMYKPAVICNGKIATINRNDSKKICVHTDSYDFVSPYRSAVLVYADAKEVALLQSDRLSSNNGGRSITDNSTLQVFDLEKREHYSFRLDELGAGTEIEKVKNGYLVTNADGVLSPVYYLMPDMGMAFNITLGQAANGGSTGDELLDIMQKYLWKNNLINVCGNKASAMNGHRLAYMDR